jgi:AcrR family transcriptional regulator
MSRVPNKDGAGGPDDSAGGSPSGPAPQAAGLRTATYDRILEGAERALASNGASGTSMEAVAAEAGVTRMTVYRYFASRDALMKALTRREMGRYFVDVLARFQVLEAEAAPGENPVPRVLVECIQLTIDHFDRHPIVKALKEHDPEMFHSFLMTKSDVIFNAAASALTPNLDRWREAGWIRELSPAWITEWVSRLVMSWINQPSAVLDAHDPDTVRELVLTFVWPVLDPDRPAPSEL